MVKLAEKQDAEQEQLAAKGGRAIFHRDYDITENQEPWHQTRPALFTKGS